jgi:CcmD family protein
MSNIGYLMAANIVVWLGVGGYLLFLAGQKRRLLRRIAQLETRLDERGTA